MNEFEIRYNAMEHAKLIMIQRLVFEIAAMKGEAGIDWIDTFRNATVSEISDTKNRDGSERDKTVSTIAQSVCVGVCDMAKDRLKQRQAEGRP